jgi:hypothetical protein
MVEKLEIILAASLLDGNYELGKDIEELLNYIESGDLSSTMVLSIRLNLSLPEIKELICQARYNYVRIKNLSLPLHG